MADNDERDEKPSAGPLDGGAGDVVPSGPANSRRALTAPYRRVADMALFAEATVNIHGAAATTAYHDAVIADLRAATASAADDVTRAQIADDIEQVEKVRAAAADQIERELATLRAIIAGSGSA